MSCHLHMQASLLPATPDTRLLKGGAAARLVADAAAGLPINLLTDAPAKGLQLSSVGLFIDQNTIRLGALGATEMRTMGGDNNRCASIFALFFRFPQARQGTATCCLLFASMLCG